MLRIVITRPISFSSDLHWGDLAMRASTLYLTDYCYDSDAESESESVPSAHG